MPFVEKWVSRWGLGFRVDLRFRACRCRFSAWLWLWGFELRTYGLGHRALRLFERIQVSIPKREPPNCPDMNSKTARLLADLRAWDSEIQEART